MKRFIAGLVAGLVMATGSFAYAEIPIKLYVNYREITCDIPPQLVDGRVMVPARFVAEPLGATVKWDEDSNSINITRTEKSFDKTVIVEPKSLNRTGATIIIGDNEFKSTVNNAILLLKLRLPKQGNMVTSYVCSVISRDTLNNEMAVASSSTDGEININWKRFLYVTKNLTEIERTMLLSSTIIHETNHIYNRIKGLYGPNNPNGLSLMEIELLGHYQERLVLKQLNAPQYLLDVASLDNVIDTNYSGTISQ